MSEGRILIVGGGQGIGAAIHAAFDGRCTVWTRRSGVDATEPEALRTAFAQLLKEHGSPYALIHTIGDFVEEPLLTTSEAQYRQLWSSNVDTVFHTLQVVVPAMIEAKRPGRVILFAAAGADGTRGMTRAPVYFAAKAAVVQLGRALALEVAAHGITVNVVSPGLIEHPHSHQESQRRLQSRVPVGRLGRVEDVVGTVRYLLSPASAYLTGQVWTIDGGLQA